MEHQVDHRQVDEVFSGLREELIILAQSAVATEPGEGSFDDPALGQHFKPLGAVAAANDHQCPSSELLDPLFQLPGVGGVDPQCFQSRALETDLLNQPTRPIAILDVGAVHHDANGQSQGIDDKMAFASFNLLASVETALRPPFSPVLTDWLSMIAALGAASRPSISRNRSWSLS